MNAAWNLLQPQMGRYGHSGLNVVSAHNSHVVLQDGRELVDLNAGYWTCLLGYSCTALTEAASAAYATLPYAHLYYRAHLPAARIAARLRDLMPPGACARVLFSNDGTGATEIALRIVSRLVERNRPLIVAIIDGGYHGDSLVVRRIGTYPLKDDRPIAPWLEILTLPGPDTPPREAIAHARELFVSMQPAALFLEIVQSVGGVRVLADEYVRELAGLCTRHDALMVIDEIATGFGRTGMMFAFERVGVVPDITLLGKAITGGYFPFAAVIAGERAAALLKDEFVHGHTTTGHPVGCEIACAVIDQLASGQLIADARAVGESAIEFLSTSLTGLATVRGRGFAIGVQLPSSSHVRAISNAIERSGYLVGQEGNTITIIPPLNIDRAEFLSGIEATAAAVMQHA
jgi:adenosylmethionine-8-amino-7-oxononanoate aminotransferase